VLDRFFTVLTITPSFLVRFWPVKCRIEALITFFRMVKERSVRFSFRSSQRSGQTLVKLSQTWSNLVKALQTLGNVSWAAFRGFSGIAGPSRVRNGLVKTVKLGQLWSTLVKLGQILGNVSQTFFLGSFDVASPRRVRPARLGLSRFACTDTRENSVGKNGVMTVAPSLFGVS
jgi:hypothetical protein